MNNSEEALAEGEGLEQIIADLSARREFISEIQCCAKEIERLISGIKKHNTALFEADIRLEPKTEREEETLTARLDAHMDADAWEQKAKEHFVEGFAALKRAINKPEGLA